MDVRENKTRDSRTQHITYGRNTMVINNMYIDILGREHNYVLQIKYLEVSDLSLRLSRPREKEPIISSTAFQGWWSRWPMLQQKGLRNT